MLANAERELIKDLFYQVCDLPDEQQIEFLSKKCNERVDLLDELSSLLASHKRSTCFFNDLTQDILGVAVNDRDIEQTSNSDPYKIINTNINDYSILEKIADGGMGVIYKANDNRLNRTVILKFLPPHLNNEPNTIRRFKREAITASNIDHVNVATIYSVERTPSGYPFISMAYYQGETLASRLEKNQFSLGQILDVISQLVSGLAVAHKKNIIHRDIKPANIMLLPDGVVKILDFGLAKISDQVMTASGLRMGTLSYMSPEHIKGDSLDLRTDIWSLGIVVYELFANKRPFTGCSDQSLMYSILNDKVELSMIEAPFSIKRMINQCLQRNPEKRYQSMEQLSITLKSIQEDAVKKSFHQHSRLIESLLLMNRGTRLLVFAVALFAMAIVSAVFSSHQEPEVNSVYQLPSNKSIAVYALQKDLTLFQQGLVKNISQSLLSISRDKSDLLVVPNEKVRTYKAFNHAQAYPTFGINLILDLNFFVGSRGNVIELNLLDSKSFSEVKSTRVLQSTENLASLQESLNSAVLNILEISNSIPVRKKLTSVGTANPVAFENYTKAQGFLSQISSKDNLLQAIELLHVSLKNDQNFYLAKAKLADSYWLLYLETKNIDYVRKAEKLYEKLLIDRPDDINSYLSLAKLHSIMGRHGTALASYKLALSIDPIDIEIFEGMASVYEKVGKIKLAEEYYLKGVELNRERWDGYNELGAFYLRQGRYAEAIKPFSKIIELAPGNAWGYANLGTANWYLGETKKTIEYFIQSLSLQEDYVLYKNLGILLFYQEDYIQAAEWYIKATKLNEEDHALFASLAGAYHYSGRDKTLVETTFRKAISLAKKKLTVLPDNVDVILSLASYYAWVNEPALSQKLLADVKGSTQLTVQHFFQIAVNYQILGELELALVWLEKALSSGYPKELLSKSPELKDLQELPEYMKLYERY